MSLMMSPPNNSDSEVGSYVTVILFQVQVAMKKLPQNDCYSMTDERQVLVSRTRKVDDDVNGLSIPSNLSAWVTSLL